MEDTIEHFGVIERIEGQYLYVRVAQQSACSGCRARSMCMPSGGNGQIVEVAGNPDHYHLNESVVISGQQAMGLEAAVLAFVIPLLLLVSAILIATWMHWDESISALSGLFLLFPYYASLYLLRNRLRKKFVFTIKKTIQ
jgi:sigma-E factor negative regulatory protein RseC